MCEISHQPVPQNKILRDLFNAFLESYRSNTERHSTRGCMMHERMVNYSASIQHPIHKENDVQIQSTF